MISFFKALSIFCEFFFMVDFLTRLAEKDRQLRQAVLVFLSLACTGIVELYLSFINPYQQNIYFTLIAGFIFLIFVLKDRYQIGSFLIVSYIAGVMAQRFAISNLFHLFLDSLNLFTEDQMTVLIFSVICVCIFLLSKIILLIGEKCSNLLTPNYYWFIFIMIQISILLVFILGERQLFSEYSVQYLTFATLLYAFVLLIVYLLCRISQDFNKALEHSLDEQQSALMAHHQLDIQELYSEIRKLRHELKNNFFYLDTLLESGEYQAAEEYLKQISELPGEIEQMVDTGNTTVNAILNSKIFQASSNNIPVHIEGALPADLQIDPSDLFALLCNLIDNALENVNPEDPSISVTVGIQKTYFSVTVTNTTKGSVLTTNPLLHTTKPERSAHGYGMKIIRSVIEKYDGILDFWEDEKGFTISALLKMEPYEEVKAE